MSYYKVMLVDDEQPVREAIAQKLAWEEIGFQVVAMAENGEDALEKAEQYAPDVVMSDISMPFMDGLTFCRKLREQMPGIRIVFFPVTMSLNMPRKRSSWRRRSIFSSRLMHRNCRKSLYGYERVWTKNLTVEGMWTG